MQHIFGFTASMQALYRTAAAMQRLVRSIIQQANEICSFAGAAESMVACHKPNLPYIAPATKMRKSNLHELHLRQKFIEFKVPQTQLNNW